MKKLRISLFLLVLFSIAYGQEDSLILEKSTQKVIEDNVIKRILSKDIIVQPKSIIHDIELEKKKQSESKKLDEQKAIIGDDYEEINNRKRLKGPTQFDSRIEIGDLNSGILYQSVILDNSNSVGIIVEKYLLSQVSDSIYHLDLATKLGDLFNLCEKEAFRNQPVAGVGTAFISGDQSMITAAHVFSGPVTNYAVIFGFQMINKVGAYVSFIESKNIYYPTEISYNSEDLDITIFTVDRIFDRKVIPHEETPISKDTEVYMIGHPMGLPQKAAVNARVYDISHPEYFYTTLDAFQGNSGSPVFNANTHKVIGILVSGELDYRWNGQCNESTLCKLPYCKGEKVIRMERILGEFD